MSLLSQVLDIVIAGVIAGAATFVAATAVEQQSAVTLGVVLASMYYFSRNPWGTTPDQATSINDRIDAVYDRILP